jgi:hypothetical protein
MLKKTLLVGKQWHAFKHFFAFFDGLAASLDEVGP